MNVLKSRINFFFIIFIIGITSCTNQNASSVKEEIQTALDSLKTIYAPDKRVALWNVSITSISDKIELIGEVDKHKTYTNIRKYFNYNYPNVKNSIKLLPTDGNKQLITGLINNSVANLRSNPRHSAEIATQALLGTPIRILKNENGWYLVQTPNKYLAWVDEQALVSIDNKELMFYKKSKKIIYNKQYGFSYSKPNCDSQTISDLVIGCILPVVSSNDNFFKVQYPDKRTAWVKKDEVVNAQDIFNKQLVEENLVKTSKKFLGIPYLWGGTSSKAIDCSGFTSMIYLMNGIVLQRDASQQIMYGKNIDKNKLEQGDLLFFGRKLSDSLPRKVTHVGMYIGNTEFIHASGKVRINSVDSTQTNFASYYMSNFLGAVRVKGVKEKNGIEQISENNFYKEIIN